MTAMSDAEEPEGWRRFVPPWWTVFFPIVVAIGAAVWHAAASGGNHTTAFVSGLLWPGGAAFLVVALMVWLGWVLDID